MTQRILMLALAAALLANVALTAALVLLDDVGFAASSAFGGPCSRGRRSASPRTACKYNRFHTTGFRCAADA